MEISILGFEQNRLIEYDGIGLDPPNIVAGPITSYVTLSLNSAGPITIPVSNDQFDALTDMVNSALALSLLPQSSSKECNFWEALLQG